MPIRLPDYVAPTPPPPSQESRAITRPTARQINQASTTIREVTTTLAGFDERVQVIYGEDEVAGLWLVQPFVSGGELVFAIAWSEGEIEGVQSVYINDTNAASYVNAHYTGTESQTVNSLLSGALAGFNDSYQGLAYSVFSVPTGQIPGFPATVRIRAVVRGRKVFDPRTNTTEWSRNPALCAADYISNTRFGPGRSVIGLEECANRCDELIGLEPRCEVGITFSDGLTLDEIMGLMSVYGEFLWAYSGDSILMVPDAPVEEPVAVLTRGDIINGTLSVSGRAANSAPTQITVRHRQTAAPGTQWGQSTQTVNVGGVTQATSRTDSEIVLLGTQRSSEAFRKGITRIRRLNYPADYSWQGAADSIRFERGDVVQLPNMDGLVDVQVRVLGVDFVGPDRYQITAERYAADIYPDDFPPSSESNLPVGAIIPYNADTAPAGFVMHTAADGLLIFGASDTHPPGTVVGSNNFTVSGLTSEDGGHSGATEFNERGSTPGAASGFRNNAAAPPHQHTYGPFDQTRVCSQARSRFIEKTGAPGPVPAGGSVFADGAIISGIFSEVTSNLGRAVAAGAPGTTGSNSFSVNVGTSGFGFAGGHNHNGTATTFTVGSTFPNFTRLYDDAPDHRHTTSLAFELQLKRALLAVYQAINESPSPTGSIVLFVGDTETLTGTGWFVADGDNGTINMVDRFIERVTASNAGALSGDNKVVWTGVTNVVSHNHEGASSSGSTSRAAFHSNNVAHSHTISGETDYRPPGRAYTIIQFVGVPE